MNGPFIGFTIGIIGEVMIGYTAIAVHNRFWKEHKIDETVFKEMKKEQIIGIVGIILIIVGFFLQIPGKL